ncbi:MAG: threonine--tRNA ligase [Clostridiales bacterium]|nr:threonine--tRNA ligase [Clostridiales bacterium]
MNIKLQDGSVQHFPGGASIYDIAQALSGGLAQQACAALVDGEPSDLRSVPQGDCSLDILKFDHPEGRHAFWHTGSHVLAQAVKRLYPEAKLTVGPAIENGFYYDIDVEAPFNPDDLEKIEAEMQKIVAEDLPIERFVLPRDEALALADRMQEPYKRILIEELPEGEDISFYRQGDFVDLCAGPHLMSTGKLAALKLLNVTGAYWKADAKNKVLQRIYGIAFPDKKQLQAHLTMLEEAKRRDHRKLGRELDLFDLYEEGPGFPFFMPKGMVIRNLLEGFWRDEHRRAGYVEIRTPIILNRQLWETSGHWFNYRENMYTLQIDEEDYAIKPMNCPGGILVYNRGLVSYRDLPQRVGELGIVHRHELSGALHGLMRVRCFTQDDAHIYMTEDQIREEILGVIRLSQKFYQLFGFEYAVELSTRPEKSMGTDEQWAAATSALQAALDASGLPYRINEGDGAFYGPKIDFHLRDCIGRTWQCGTIQLDMQMPERFDMSYIGPDGEKHRPVMIHRTIFGSIERFIGILTEHFAGAFPVWLSPVQVELIPITDKHHAYAEQLKAQLADQGFRVESDLRSEKMGFKIREAQLQKVPYMLVLGDKEVEAGVVAVRSRKDGDLGVMRLEDFVARLRQEVDSKALD